MAEYLLYLFTLNQNGLEYFSKYGTFDKTTFQINGAQVGYGIYHDLILWYILSDNRV